MELFCITVVAVIAVCCAFVGDVDDVSEIKLNANIESRRNRDVG